MEYTYTIDGDANLLVRLDKDTVFHGEFCDWGWFGVDMLGIILIRGRTCIVWGGACW